MKHVLVTGGAGFIGSHLADAYLARGWRVTVIDNFSTGKRENVNPRVELLERDLRDPATADVVTELRPDVVSHHAAQIDVRVSVADPGADAEANVVASVRLLQKAHDAGVKRFIFASTGGAIYGEPVTGGLQDESHPRTPLSPYGCAKLSVEQYMHYFREVLGLNTVALRYANVYGPRQSAKGEAGVVAIFAGKLLGNEEVTINGDGEQTRDFVHIDDVVRANMAVTETADAGPFNVGTGVETSINTLHDVLRSAAGSTSPARHAPAKVGEQQRSVLDGTLLRRTYGVAEPVTLPDGIAGTLQWFRDARR